MTQRIVIDTQQAINQRAHEKRTILIFFGFIIPILSIIFGILWETITLTIVGIIWFGLVIYFKYIKK